MAGGGVGSEERNGNKTTVRKEEARMQPTDARDEMADEGRKEGLGWAGCAQSEMSYRNTGLVSSLLCFSRIKSRDPSPHLALHFKKKHLVFALLVHILPGSFLCFLPRSSTQSINSQAGGAQGLHPLQAQTEYAACSCAPIRPSSLARR